MIKDLFEEDANAAPSEQDLKLGELGKLAIQQLDLEKELEKLGAELAVVTAKHREISERKIPDLMQQLGGITKLTIQGFELKVVKVYGASISEQYRDAAFTWLREHQHDALIKNDVIAKFGKGEDKAAAQFIQLVMSEGYEVEQKKYVHPQTLKAFVKEQIEKGVDLPQDVFGVFTGYKTTIKRG